MNGESQCRPHRGKYTARPGSNLNVLLIAGSMQWRLRYNAANWRTYMTTRKMSTREGAGRGARRPTFPPLTATDIAFDLAHTRRHAIPLATEEESTFTLPTQAIGDAFEKLVRAADKQYEDTANNHHQNYAKNLGALSDAAIAYVAECQEEFGLGNAEEDSVLTLIDAMRSPFNRGTAAHAAHDA
jgi:hypothetical protein